MLKQYKEYVLRVFLFLMMLLLFLFTFSLYARSHAGEVAGVARINNMGITPDGSSRNADRVRRSQNRRTRFLNEINNAETVESAGGGYYCPAY